MVNVKEWLYPLLSTNAALLALLGSSSHVVDAWPETVTVFPLLIYVDQNQLDKEYADNKPMMKALSLNIDIFIKIDSGITTTDIGEIVEDILSAEYFHCGMNGEVPDPTDGVRHRAMKFSRDVFPSDL